MSEQRIDGGIEWYALPPGNGSGCQCARCGSSCDWLYCWNCDDGFVEKNVGDDVVEELEEFPCEYCAGTGGSFHCLSSPEWCEANPLPDRAHITSTALRSEAWTENA